MKGAAGSVVAHKIGTVSADSRAKLRQSVVRRETGGDASSFVSLVWDKLVRGDGNLFFITILTIRACIAGFDFLMLCCLVCPGGIDWPRPHSKFRCLFFTQSRSGLPAAPAAGIICFHPLHQRLAGTITGKVRKSRTGELFSC